MQSIDISTACRKFLQLTGATTFIIGLMFLTMSNLIVHFFTGDRPRNVIFVMFLGTSLLGYSTLNWQAARRPQNLNLRAVLNANLAALAPAMPLSIYAVAGGQMNLYGYFIVGLHIFFASGFYFFRKAITQQDLS